MEFVNLNVGLKSYQLVEGGAALRFNPGDPNVYSRFLNALDEMKQVEQEESSKAKQLICGESLEEQLEYSKKSMKIMEETDSRFKQILNKSFGFGNDFDAIFCGVNLAAVNEDGKRPVELFVDWVTPILREGAERLTNAEIDTARLNREQRRALGL